MLTTEWFCQIHREVSPGIIGTLGNLAIREAIATIAQANERLVILNATTALMAPVVPDGQQLLAVGTVRHRRADIIAPQAEITDQDGQIVAIVQGAAACWLNAARVPPNDPASVCSSRSQLTDPVGSTERAEQLGDARWRALLDDHHAVIRRQLELHKGREVADSPATAFSPPSTPLPAVPRPSRSVTGRETSRLKIRKATHRRVRTRRRRRCRRRRPRRLAGAVNGPAGRDPRVEHGYETSSMNEGLQPVDRGVHELKGLEGTWTLLAVKDDRPVADVTRFRARRTLIRHRPTS